MKRIWQYKFHYLIALPAFLWLLYFKIIPFFIGGVAAFKDYKIVRGIFGSRWAGWANFNSLFEDPQFLYALRNAFAYKLSFALVAGIVAVIFAVALSGIRSNIVRHLFCILFLIPFFIPSSVFADVVMYLLSPSRALVFSREVIALGDAAYYPFVVVIALVIKSCGIPIAVGTAAIRAYRNNRTARGMHAGSAWLPSLQAAAAFFLLQLSTLMTVDFELLFRLINPLVYSVGDTLDTYSFRMTFVNADYQIGSAIGLVQFAIQFVCTLLTYFFARGFLKKTLFSGEKALQRDKTEENDKARNIVGILSALAFGAVIVYLLYYLFVYPFFHGGGGSILSSLRPTQNFMLYFVVYGAATFVYMLFTLTLAYPLTAQKFPGRTLYILSLLFVLAMGSGGTISEYLQLHDLEATGTIFPLFFNGLLSIAGVFVLKSIFNAGYGSLREQAERDGTGEARLFFFLFVPNVWKPLLGLGVLHFVSLWNSYKAPFIYLSRDDAYPPVLRSVQLIQEETVRDNFEAALQFGAIVSLPSLLLLFVFYRFLTSEVLVGELRK